MRYIRSSKNLVKLYRWDRKVMNSELNKGQLVIKLVDEYNPYEKIKIDEGRNFQGAIIQGTPLLLPEGSETVEIYNLNGNRLRKFDVSSGNGGYGLQDNRSGINLNSDSGYVKLGVGFEDSRLVIKVKEWSSRIEKYNFIIKSKGRDKNIEQLIEIVTVPQKIKVLSEEINLDFGYVNRDTKDGKIEKIESVDIQVPNGVTGIKTSFSQGDILVMKRVDGDEVLNAKPVSYTHLTLPTIA